MKKSGALLGLILICAALSPALDRRLEDSSGLYAVRIGDDWGFINIRGEVVIEPRFESVGFFSEGLVPCMTGGLWGYADGAGKFVIPPRFESTYEFREDRAHVSVDGPENFIDREGRLLLPDTLFMEGQNFSEGLAAVRPYRNGKICYIDKAGQFVIAPGTTWPFSSAKVSRP